MCSTFFPKNFLSIKEKDNILIIGPTTGVIEQKIKSMEINHKKVKKAKKGQYVAIKVDKLVRENDKLFLQTNKHR